jgi:hypothetical protein
MSPVFGDSDIPILFADMGVSVTIGAVTLPKGGILDTSDDRGLFADLPVDVITQTKFLLVQTSAFPALLRNASAVVDGVAYKIRDHRRIDDGGLSVVALVKP